MVCKNKAANTANRKEWIIMKRRYAAIVLGLTLTFTSASFAYAAAETADSTAEKAEEAAQEEVYGEVTETGDDSITVNTGTLKEEAKPAEGEKAASETENAEAETMREENKSRVGRSGGETERRVTD